MKNDKFTEIGYPAGSKLIGDYMRAMLEIGEKHANIKKFNESLRSLKKVIRSKNASTSKQTKR